MGRVISGITTSLDGYITGPHDGPGNGLGDGGERLHYWVFGGPWSYAEGTHDEATGADKAYLESANANLGAVIGGRWTYEAADHWGGHNPWPVPFFIVTHRPDEEPREGGFTFVDGLDEALRRAQAVAGEKDVEVMGGADLIRQALRAGYVDGVHPDHRPGRARRRQAAPRWLRGGPPAGTRPRAPVAVGDPHHLSGAPLTIGGRLDSS
jgi:dihydrofolate reductase